ncbi:MAG: DUF2207 domain-containing protein [Gammaproteobacteria bacterium]|nr:DUF2207 domain-containing protein [Gammaproteobacteria bacterium]
MSRNRIRVFALLLLVVGAVTGESAWARSLWWPAIDVNAQLDAKGRLHVEERQTIEFDGAWNGGERVFDIRNGQEFRLLGITRTDPLTGAETPLTGGNLTAVDQFRWFDGTTVRWRARLPSDPPFQQQRIVYTLSYRIGNVLQATADGYRLAHDFAFANRQDRIGELNVSLELDPVWQSEHGNRIARSTRNLPPGRGAVLTLDLRYAGEEAGRKQVLAIPAPAGPELVAGVFGLAALLILWLRFRFRRHERDRGREHTTQLADGLDAADVERLLSDLAPEEAGALWDRKVGAPEVAAVLARLVAEGKLASEVQPGKGFFKKSVLQLKRRVDFADFDGYDRSLVRKLFFNNRRNTDTDAIRDHYKKAKTGFSPASLIRPRINQRLEKMGFARSVGKPSAKTSLWLWALIGIALVLEYQSRGQPALAQLAMLPMGLLMPWIFGLWAAYWYQGRVDHAGWKAGLFQLFIGLVFLAFGVSAWLGAGGEPWLPELTHGFWGLLAAALVPVVIANHLFNIARTRESAATVKRRQQLNALREQFRAELSREQPQLQDEWFPYLLALGLEREVDSWFREFGATSQAMLLPATTGRSGGGTPSWTGGGGSFGGAGATATWAGAAQGLAAGVSAPSSGGSGGGGGGFSGGGGSSGGGGGGGW